MTKSFLTCTNCGQRSTDTKRCKHCGQVFGRAPQPVDDSSPKRNWLPVLAVIGVAAIVGVGLQQWSRRPPVVPSTVAPETTIVAAPAETAVATPTSPAPVAVTPVDTPRAVTPARVEPPKEVADTPRPETPVPSAAPVAAAIDVTRQRYATTWANVRAERNNTAAVLQVLDRGEIVAIDSLEGGWYRVTTDRPVVGYVDQQFLDTLPPAKP